MVGSRFSDTSSSIPWLCFTRLKVCRARSSEEVAMTSLPLLTTMYIEDCIAPSKRILSQYNDLFMAGA